MQEESTLSPIQLFFRNKWVRLFLIIDLLLIIILIIILIWQSTKTSTINLNVTPLDSVITISGHPYNNGQYSITPGSYDITVSHEGLATKSFKIDIPPQSIATITTFLLDDNKTFNYYKQKENYMSFQKLEEIASNGNNTTTDKDTSAELFITLFNKQYNLIANSLPIRYDTYEHDPNGWDSLIKQIIIIKPEKTDPCVTSLCIKALMGINEDRDLVNNILQEKGFDTNEVEILYEKE